MEIVGLVPARGGSRAIPRKNLVPLGARPLIEWTIDAARESKRLTRVVVSTDSQEIADAALDAGAEVPFRRPAEIATGDTPMVDVILHALDELGAVDVLVLLQPTSPLRRGRHIDEAVDLLLETGADGVVSVVEVPHQFRPESLMRLEDGRLAPLVDDAPTRRQDKAPVFARNGPAVLAVRPDAVRARGDLYGGDCRGYVMEPRDSVDVDGPYELALAEFLLTRPTRIPAWEA